MRCIVTAGPTWEPLDGVRRLTNFSTGSLGGELANRLVLAGHSVTLLLSETAVWNSPLAAVNVQSFSTAASLGAALQQLATEDPVVVFHAAAVGDFFCGGVWSRDSTGTLDPVRAGKLSTRTGPLWVELSPTPKILPQLPRWFPKGRIVGWKYEMDGDRAAALQAARDQLQTAGTLACVVNGAAYGPGFGLLLADGTQASLPDRPSLVARLETFAREA
jgi:phosphopantothenoylcysteine synthetase/decarboxylase